ncbi:MAG: methyltransferase domain-containing protein [Candidatus Bathyarchaeia archaeon]
MESLNVGCGSDKWGDVRVDITKYNYFSGDAMTGRTSANVLASIEYLPFKNQAFKLVRCYHTLEHVDNPQKALNELLRIGKVVDIKVPPHNFYCMVYSILALSFVIKWAIKSKNKDVLFRHLKGIRNWTKKQTGGHKWYIKLKDVELIKWKYLPIPIEYRKIYNGGYMNKKPIKFKICAYY